MAQSNVPKISKQAAANIIEGKKGCHVLLNKDVTFAGRRRKQQKYYNPTGFLILHSSSLLFSFR